MASPDTAIEQQATPGLRSCLWPLPARPWSPKASSSTAVLPVEPELYLGVLARVAAASHQAAWANR
jgi:hypothetical protein